MIRRNGSELKAASKLPVNICHVPKPVTASTNKIMRPADNFDMPSIVQPDK